RIMNEYNRCDAHLFYRLCLSPSVCLSPLLLVLLLLPLFVFFVVDNSSPSWLYSSSTFVRLRKNICSRAIRLRSDCLPGNKKNLSCPSTAELTRLHRVVVVVLSAAVRRSTQKKNNSA